MTRLVFAILDRAAMEYVGQPMVVPHEAVAARAFAQACMNKETLMSMHPKDFVLVRIGQFDDLTLSGCDPVEVLSAEAVLAVGQHELGIVREA